MRVLAFTILLLSHAVVQAAEIRLGVHNFPPYFVMQDSNNCGGEAVELTRKLLQTDNIKVTAVCATPARLYKLLQSGDVDLTINIKHTKALPDNVSFIAPPFVQLSLVLLTHGAAVAREKQPTIAAIRGFDYHGQRQILTEKGYTFIDLPDSISAVEMFIKGRSSALLTYDAPFDYYLKQHQLPFARNYQCQLLEQLDAFYVMSEQSAAKSYISDKLSQYARKAQLSYFTQ
ncbi:transporter substrate-binding domain-containing protein [Rheinheimera muenzenbergensis]|uniref:Transporter substrate-binding domain-containing protein n=1 Tax=Rheinheimera muenzenbergensis TaxID=1193628 RepID=A0ABU8C9A1_9GAMM